MEGAIFIILARLGFALAVPLIIFGILLHRVRILQQSWKPILFKAICAVVAWACFSFLMLHVDFFFVYTSAHTPPGARSDITPVITLLANTFVYGLAGWGLCHWVGRARHVAVFD